MRPWTSSAAASAASRRTERSVRASSVRERDALDTLVEHDLAVERPVHRALGSDDAQALDLLVDVQIVAANPHDMAVSAVTSGGGLHPVQPPALRYSSGLKSNPVGTLGKKYVDFEGTFTPAAATSRTCWTGVERRKNAASYSPERTSCSASSPVRL